MDYYDEQKKNEEIFLSMLKTFRPDVFAIMTAMDEENMNWKVIFHTIHALGNIALDTKYGQVNILIENNEVKFIRGEHANKINEPILNIKIEPTVNNT